MHENSGAAQGRKCRKKIRGHLRPRKIIHRYSNVTGRSLLNVQRYVVKNE